MMCRLRYWRLCVRFSELDGARIGVWGAGREITSFADQLARRLPSARIVAAAFDAPPAGDVRQALSAPNARIVTGAEIAPVLGECEVVVRSPGVSIHRPEMLALREAAIPVTTSTSLWLSEHGGRGVIGVTGTKGKSTTAALVSHLARAAGRTVRLAGNIGVPALDLLDSEPGELDVVELSSYHIADLSTGPEVALITNLFREHTDWHGSEDVYRAEKLRILTLPGVHVGVVNGRDRQLVAAAANLAADDAEPQSQTRFFGVPGGWDVLPEGIVVRGERVMAIPELQLLGEHNALNLCAALTALEALGIVPPPLPGSLSGFQPLPHRLETVAEEDGLLWVDDSISTTPESTLAALASFPGRDVVLIGGGQDRGQNYGELGRVLVEVGAAVIGVPSTGSRLLSAARDAGLPATRAIDAADMHAAVTIARGVACPGGVVLLSPAAPSYDNYRDFQERGELFRELVERR
jgi:UDP-N-acetylmuramoyl-L-alanine---L-glutamate ligase